MVEMKFNLTKRDFVWIGLIIGLAFVGFGFSYGGHDPSIMGHSAGEVESPCAAGQFLDGDGSCRTAAQIVSDGGGSGTVGIKVYLCPAYNAGGGVCARGGVSTCNGDISTRATCTGSCWVGGSYVSQTRTCTYVGRLMPK